MQNRPFLIGAIILIVCICCFGLAAAGAVTYIALGTPLQPPVPSPGSTEARFVGISVPDMGAPHVAPGQPHDPYNSMPPTSGPHFDAAAPWGIYASPLPDERWVINLEHSGVVALYNCPQSCPDLMGKLAAFLKNGPPSKVGYVKLLIMPYTKTQSKLTLVAWNYYLELPDYDDGAMRGFFAAHQDKGPEQDVP